MAASWPDARLLVNSLRARLRASRVGITFGIANRPDALAILYGGTDKHVHGYMRYYKRHLGALRFRQNLIIEIGVGGIGQEATAAYLAPEPGGSLFLWRDYFCRSKIVGIDIYEKDVRLGHRVSFIQADQSSPADLQRVIAQVGNPNIVIDDGSHVGTHVVSSFQDLFPLLSPGGTYVIEDLCTSYYPKYGDILHHS